MKSLKQTYKITAPISKVWRALVDPKIIDQWDGGPAKMNDKEGEDFSLWGGDIFGKNIKVISDKKLVQEWYAGKWNKPSIVTIELKQDNNDCIIELSHINIPDKEFEGINLGWNQYYFGRIKDLLEK